MRKKSKLNQWDYDVIKGISRDLGTVRDVLTPDDRKELNKIRKDLRNNNPISLENFLSFKKTASKYKEKVLWKFEAKQFARERDLIEKNFNKELDTLKDLFGEETKFTIAKPHNLEIKRKTHLELFEREELEKMKKEFRRERKKINTERRRQSDIAEAAIAHYWESYLDGYISWEDLQRKIRNIERTLKNFDFKNKEITKITKKVEMFYYEFRPGFTVKDIKNLGLIKKERPKSLTKRYVNRQKYSKYPKQWRKHLQSEHTYFKKLDEQNKKKKGKK